MHFILNCDLSLVFHIKWWSEFELIQMSGGMGLEFSRAQYLTSSVSHGPSISRVGPVSHGSSISRASISRTQYLTDPVSHGPTVSHHSISRHSSISRQYLTLPGSQLFFKISQLFSNSEISQKARISACLTRISRRMETCLR